jgi:hypothetical protein
MRTEFCAEVCKNCALRTAFMCQAKKGFFYWRKKGEQIWIRGAKLVGQKQLVGISHEHCDYKLNDMISFFLIDYRRK